MWLEPRLPVREINNAQQVYKFPDSVTIFLQCMYMDLNLDLQLLPWKEMMKFCFLGSAEW